jgi:hypothetical protein
VIDATPLLDCCRRGEDALAMSMNLMARLNERDLMMRSNDRNVPDPLRIAARRKVVGNVSRR